MGLIKAFPKAAYHGAADGAVWIARAAADACRYAYAATRIGSRAEELMDNHRVFKMSFAG